MVACGVPPDPERTVKTVTIARMMLNFVDSLPDLEGHRIAAHRRSFGTGSCGVISKKICV